MKMNQVICGESPQSLQPLRDGSFQLIYLDPPFFTQKEQKLRPRGQRTEYSYRDIWPNLQGYLDWLEKLLIESRRLLAKEGSIFVHCDWRASHYIRLLLDTIFDRSNFRNEIIWSYRRWTNASKSLQRTHQNIYFYAASSSSTINPLYEAYSPSTNLDQIWQKRAIDSNGRSTYMYNESGSIAAHGEVKQGVPLRDVWDIPYLNPKAKERVGYPSQKPIELLERIILLASNPGDSVLDPCCGSGTTLVAADINNRQWFGVDRSPQAVALAKQRLSNPIVSRSKIISRGREAFQDDGNSENQHLRYLLDILGAHPVYRNRAIDGFLRNTPTNDPVAVSLFPNKVCAKTRRQAFIAELKRTATPYGLIVREEGSLRERQLSLLPDDQGTPRPPSTTTSKMNKPAHQQGPKLYTVNEQAIIRDPSIGTRWIKTVSHDPIVSGEE